MTKDRAVTIGLTGSIGMGKSTVAGFFADCGAAVWDADEAVHRLYDVGGAGVGEIHAIVPSAVAGGKVSRAALSAAIGQNPELLKKVEAAIHPLVAQDRANFRKHAHAPVLVFDIPLIFEGGMTDEFDHIVVVSANAAVQSDRVLAREGMTTEKFEFILSKQIPDTQKRAQADFIIETDLSFDDTRAQVKQIYEKLTG